MHSKIPNITLSAIAIILAASLLAHAYAAGLAAPQSAQRAVIVEDQEAAAFRFIIDGKEVARLDGTGLHVRESLSYGGVLTDYGTGTFDRLFREPEEAADVE